MNKNIKATLYALGASVFYAVNIPISKILLKDIDPTIMASLLYLGAGIGIFILSKVIGNKDSKKLDTNDLIYVIGMIILDVVAPILLMIGLSLSKSSNVSLLNNFEIIVTSLIAYFIFKEKISKRLLISIILIIIASIFLTIDFKSSFNIDMGSLLVLIATICWGLENNCTKMISSKNTFDIVIIKGISSGLCMFIISLLLNENIPRFNNILIILLLGFISYGLSIFLYVKSQNIIGASKTSAYYATSPFIASILSIIFLKESFNSFYIISFIIMLFSAIIIVIDTLIINHSHYHIHISNKKVIRHKHKHNHYISVNKHNHIHKKIIAIFHPNM